MLSLNSLPAQPIGANVKYECLIEGHPLNESSIEWHVNGQLINESNMRMRHSVEPHTNKQLKSEFFIYNVTVNDSNAQIECRASNQFNQLNGYSVMTTHLIVNHQPIIDREARNLKYATKNGASKTNLICRAKGSPEVHFEWFRGGQNVVNSTHYGHKYVIEMINQIDLITFESRLTILNVSLDDLGEYQCFTRNSLGFDGEAIQLNLTSKPDQPFKLSIINITSNAMLLKWVPSFDGGMKQSFRIRFKQLDERSFRYKDCGDCDGHALWIDQLQPNQEYTFNIQSINDLGESQFTQDIVKAKTLRMINHIK